MYLNKMFIIYEWCDFMELRNIVTFLKAAQLKNFAKVADELGYVPSTVTMQIQQLENELGFLLFDRVGKRVELTNLGMQFMKYANDMITLTDQIKRLGIEPMEIEEHIRIGILESLCSVFLLPKLPEFSTLFPNVTLEIITGSSSDLLSMLKRCELDIIYILGKKIIEKDIISVHEKQENIVFVASSSHPLSNMKLVPLDLIIQDDLILTEKISLYRHALEEIAANNNMLIEPHIEINNTYFIVSLLLQNSGISFLPEYIVRDEVLKGTLSVLQTKGQKRHFLSQIFLRNNKWVSPQLQGLINILKE